MVDPYVRPRDERPFRFFILRKHVKRDARCASYKYKPYISGLTKVFRRKRRQRRRDERRPPLFSRVLLSDVSLKLARFAIGDRWAAVSAATYAPRNLCAKGNRRSIDRLSAPSARRASPSTDIETSRVSLDFWQTYKSPMVINTSRSHLTRSLLFLSSLSRLTLENTTQFREIDHFYETSVIIFKSKPPGFTRSLVFFGNRLARRSIKI